MWHRLPSTAADRTEYSINILNGWVFPAVLFFRMSNSDLSNSLLIGIVGTDPYRLVYKTVRQIGIRGVSAGCRFALGLLNELPLRAAVDEMDKAC